MSDLLLYSLAEFRDVIFPVLELVKPTSVTEIGGEGGTFTQELLTWAEANGVRVCCIDPAPSDALVRMMEGSEAGELRRSLSVEALAEMEPAEVYLVDGDHNYYTLASELRAIEQAAPEKFPLLFLHDVGWPAGRRDMYYDPASIPPEARHAYSYEKGVTVGCPGLVEDGFSGDGDFAWAEEEGGPANGVRTAVEDFLADRTDLRFQVVPCIFGLGVLHPENAPYAAGLADLLGRYTDNPLLERLEQNRITLYLRVLKIQHEMVSAIEQSALRARDLEVENRALWARVDELQRELHDMTTSYQALAGEVDAMVRARSFALAEKLSRLHGRLGETHGLSRERLRALLDERPAPVSEQAPPRAVR